MQKLQTIDPASISGTAVSPMDLSATFSILDATSGDNNYLYVAGYVGSPTFARRIKRYSPVTLAEDTAFGTMMNSAVYPAAQSLTGIVVLGNLAYATFTNTSYIYRIDLTNANTTLIGNGSPSYVDGVSSSAGFNTPGAVTTDGISIFIADNGNHVIRRIDPSSSNVTTFAGAQFVGNYNGGGQSDDGPANQARFDSISGLAVNGGYLYASETYRNRIRRINLATGQVLTVLGGFDPIQDGVGPFGSVGVANPSALAADATNGLYIANDFNIRALK
jgi:hypothetical protein